MNLMLKRGVNKLLYFIQQAIYLGSKFYHYIVIYIKKVMVNIYWLFL